MTLFKATALVALLLIIGLLVSGCKSPQHRRQYFYMQPVTNGRFIIQEIYEVEIDSRTRNIIGGNWGKFEWGD